MELDLGKLPRTTLGGTCGKYKEEQAIIQELNERQAFMNRQMSLTGLKQVDAVVMSFGAKPAGALTSRREEMPHVVSAGGRYNPAPRASSARQMRLNAIVTGQASLRKGTPDIPKVVAAPRLTELHVVGVNVVGQMPRKQEAVLKEEDRIGAGGQNMMRPGLRARASARRIFSARNATSCDVLRPSTAPAKGGVHGGSFADDSLTIRGMFSPPSQVKPPLDVEAKAPVSVVKIPSPIESGMRGSYLVMEPECHVIKGMRPAQRCMPARVFYGSLKARTPSNDQTWGRVDVFENANHK